MNKSNFCFYSKLKLSTTINLYYTLYFTVRYTQQRTDIQYFQFDLNFAIAKKKA